MRKRAIALIVLATAAAGAAQAQDISPAARAVIARARAASGGDAWNRLRGWRESGQSGGLRYDLWADPLRYGMRREVREPAGLRVHGFNGAGDWEISPAGAVTALSDRPALARARSQAYMAAHGLFFPSRFAADADYVGVRQSGGRSFDVVKVVPAGGRAREVWFDRRSHLLARIIDRDGVRPVTTELSDYRRAGPVMAAFRFTIDDGEPAHRQSGQIDSLTFAAPDRAMFSLPRVIAVPAPAAAAPAPEVVAPRRRWPMGTLFERRAPQAPTR